MSINLKDKRLWAAGGVIAAVAFSFTLFNGKDTVYTYTYNDVEKRTVKKTVSVSGKLDLHERILVRSEIGGEVTNIYADYNERVEKDELLLEIFSEEILESFEQYSDTYRFKRVDLENAYDLYQTKKELYEEELISEREFSDTRLSYQRMESSFREVKKEYERRKELLDSRMVYSPVSGTIINRNVENNQKIGGGHLLFEIAPTLTKMNLTINIDESDIGIVEKGQEVTFTVSAYPDEVFTGTIREVRMNPHNINGITMYKSLVVCDNREEKLKPGMSATATIHIGKKDNVLAVPNQAFMVTPPNASESEPGSVVWVKKSVSVANESPVTMVEIETGLRGDSFTEITSGEIKESDEVLISVFKEKQ